LDLIRDLRDQRDMAVLFITHDLGVIAEIADDVLVMYRGKVVEQGDVLSVYSNPQHPYTKGLLSCRARLDTKFKRLPTVSDFMDTVENEDGTVQISEKAVSEKQMEFFRTHGRGRLLHPTADLKRLGYDDAASNYADGATSVSDDLSPLLRVHDLKVHFPVKKGFLMRVVDHVKAVDGVTFDIYRGQTLGLVGESGCGKTTTGRALTRLVRPTSGTMTYDGHDIQDLRGGALQNFRSQMQIIFQDPYGSMNPRMTIQTSLVEPMAIHGIGTSKSDRIARAASLLDEVGMLPEHLSRYPHEFSGGQRQRICIARALSVEPEFIVCDESVSALDVSIQAQVLNLLNDLQEQRNLTYIFISHDLSVVKFMSDMMAVMNDGQFIEFGPSESIYANPQQDYTQKLIQATPRDDLENIESLVQKRKETRQAKQAAADPQPR
ncbi:MAG: ABC transporter ATP-binding protein, partial [Pirellulaceae bacterium]